ncbi:hypothetical protein QTI05_24170 [Variovorax sp. J22R193]|uniref:hypothetical protein n=1 Tax=Variovorax fucosicus TaxID=3053517 RepID=UPI00257807B1|nr:hypothetical protein [Variovorax sp. J22R193]MDM0042156.1 hypothetical protein [Variovorax sp. J22R193]
MTTINKFNKFLLTQMNGGQDTTGSSTANAARVVDFDSDTIKVSLHTSTYSPSATGHAAYNSVTNEVTGSGYTSGGITLTSPTVVDTAGTIAFDAADITWSQNASGFTNARYAVIYKSTGTAATSTLIGWIDFVADKGNVSGDLVMQWNASGVATWA